MHAAPPPPPPHQQLAVVHPLVVRVLHRGAAAPLHLPGRPPHRLAHTLPQREAQPPLLAPRQQRQPPARLHRHGAVQVLQRLAPVVTGARWQRLWSRLLARGRCSHQQAVALPLRLAAAIDGRRALFLLLAAAAALACACGTGTGVWVVAQALLPQLEGIPWPRALKAVCRYKPISLELSIACSARGWRLPRAVAACTRCLRLWLLLLDDCWGGGVCLLAALGCSALGASIGTAAVAQRKQHGAALADAIGSCKAAGRSRQNSGQILAVLCCTSCICILSTLCSSEVVGALSCCACCRTPLCAVLLHGAPHHMQALWRVQVRKQTRQRKAEQGAAPPPLVSVSQSSRCRSNQKATAFSRPPATTSSFSMLSLQRSQARRRTALLFRQQGGGCSRLETRPTPGRCSKQGGCSQPSQAQPLGAARHPGAAHLPRPLRSPPSNHCSSTFTGLVRRRWGMSARLTAS